VSGVEFRPWPKIARLNRDIVITEKIDGTNAAVVIVPIAAIDHIQNEDGSFSELFEPDASNASAIVGDHVVFAQSRNRFITPERDNYGFAGWVKRNATALIDTLGEGTHFGEWWGSGIQRKYGLKGDDKRFSLFNVRRWTTNEGLDAIVNSGVRGLDVVPVLYEGPFSQACIDNALLSLRLFGSLAAPGFARPEGIVIFHTASSTSYKVTLEGDEAPKGAAGHAMDEERVAA